MAQVRSKWISESDSTAFLGPLCKNLWWVHLLYFKTLKIVIFSNRNPDRLELHLMKEFYIVYSLISTSNRIPVPIASVPIKTNGKYSPSDFPTIRQFENEYKLAGGVNLPKIMNCLGSDGKKYKMLVKGTHWWNMANTDKSRAEHK